MSILLSGASLAHAQDVKALSCIPLVIAGGSGGSTTCTVTLAGPAAAAGVPVTLKSSLPALAASALRTTVPAGASTASFQVKTNPRYRRYSGLAFNATISASVATTANATINVTAQARPAPIDSGVQIGQRFQWQGSICGGFSPVGQGDSGVLYTCSPATKTQNGTCTFKQECSIGCDRHAVNGTTFSDTCATTGSNPVSILQPVVTGGDRVDATAISPSVAVAGNLTQVLPIIVSTPGIGNIGGASAYANWFPHDQGAITFPTGANSVPFNLATSYVPEPVWEDVRVNISSAGSVTVTQGRAGQQWLTLVPTEHPAPLPVPTLASLALTGNNPVTGGQMTFAGFETSGISSGGSGPFFFTSSNPAVAQVPASLTLPASTVFGSDVYITTTNPAVDTPVTITATDGRYTFSTGLLVTHFTPPLLQSLTIDPSHVVGGATANATIGLSVPAPAGGAVATLIGIAGPAQFPSTVTVPAGATSVTFPITTMSVTSPATVNITAVIQGVQQNASLAVTQGGTAATFAAFGISPSPITPGGAAPLGFVQLAFPAPAGDAAIAMTSSTPALQVPAIVTVPAGDLGAYFTVTASNVTTTASGTVTATYNGVADVIPVTVSPKPNTVNLDISTAGKAGNSIMSTPAGISVAVGNGQVVPFAPGTSITLAVSGGRSAIFSGACSTGGQKATSCKFTITADASVSVNVQ